LPGNGNRFDISTVKIIVILALAALIGFVVAWSVNDVYQKYLVVEEIKKEEEEARKELDGAMADRAERKEELNRLVERGVIN
jgi:phosphate/sulfate permease